MKSQQITINFNNKIKAPTIFEAESYQILKNFINYFKLTKKQSIILDVSIVSRNEIKSLNKIYRKKNYITDILSFDFGDAELYDKLPLLHLGELVICWDRVKRQAKRYNHSIKREFCYLFTHGLVHLQGYDHEEEQERLIMNSIVDAIFNPLKITRKDQDYETRNT
ncbi:rRNA maturation RNase YbeY [Mycoplasmopsis bovirhinis]|uniref:rRNA maturation RNase YbeY n=1 Tax=Mycoplasmopsis bovirhinis TaxID=29553 RepID=UPI000C05954C|nr:rRNA maturation RNase YbeY [Mycoplasmopsis bovirhinis]ATO30733.1 rRNA maturation RNase YbeY [Mycoplasmopsis bovirhinis]